MFELLQNYFFTGVTGNTAYAILQKFWQQLFGKELEELYLDAFEQAVVDQRSHLSKYGDSSKLDREALRRALRSNVALDLGQTSLSDLSEGKFIQCLAETLYTQEVMTIGGHNLSLEDYHQLLRNLIRQANRTLRQKVFENEVAFDQILLTEVQDNYQQLEQVQTYLNTKFNLVLNQLVSIKTDTSLLPEMRAKLQKVADDVQAIRDDEDRNNTTPDLTGGSTITPGTVYNIHVEQATGLAIGDKAQVTQSSATQHRPGNPPSTPNRRCADLTKNIHEVLDLIKQYEEQRRLTSDPKEKRRAEREIADLRKQLSAYQVEAHELGCE